MDNTSLQEILDAADISKGTFYKYFATKDECVAEMVKQTHDQIRRELNNKLIGQSPDTNEIFLQQLTLYLEMIYKYHLYQLVRVIRQGQNQELRQIAFSEEQSNIRWMADRTAEVYGDEYRPFCREAATLFYGILQTIIISHEVRKKPLNFEKTTRITLKYMELILEELKTSHETVFDFEESYEVSVLTKDHLIENIMLVKKTALEADQQLLEGILEELQKHTLRKSIVLALTRSLSSAVNNIKKDIECFIL